MKKNLTSDEVKVSLVNDQGILSYRGDDLEFIPYNYEQFIETMLSVDHIQFFTTKPDVIYELERLGPDTWSIEQHPYKRSAVGQTT